MRTETQRFRRTVVSRAAITALWGTAALLASQETLAQQSSLERVEITGSAIRRVDAETALPVTVLKVDELKQQGFTILLVEQNFRFAQTVADRHYIVEHGRVVDVVPGAALEANMGRVHEYLGV